MKTTGRVVVFGATGYTGRLVTDALLRRGHQPLIVGRSAERLQTVSEEFGVPLEMAVADAHDPAGLARLLAPGDVLLTTVGPYAWLGGTAVDAAITAGAHCIDVSGEPAFMRAAVQRHGPRAADARIALLTSFAYDCVPGNLAAALAATEAGASATRLDVGYFMLGPSRPSNMGGGTRASIFPALFEPAFARRSGDLVDERSCRSVRRFDAAGRRRSAVSIGSTEAFFAPQQFRDVEVYIGWYGAGSRAVQAAAALAAAAGHVSAVRSGVRRLARRAAPSRGPDGLARARTRTHVVAVASDDAGRPLAEVHLAGASPYSFTANIAAWAAAQAASGKVSGAGALGPVEAFGLQALQDGCAEVGLPRTDSQGHPLRPEPALRYAPPPRPRRPRATPSPRS